jgi:hypothetical protein
LVEKKYKKETGKGDHMGLNLPAPLPFELLLGEHHRIILIFAEQAN